MTDEIKEVVEEIEPKLDEQIVEESLIQLTPDQYNAILDKIEELEQAAIRKPGDKVDADYLVEEARRRPQQTTPQQTIDLENLTNAQLVEVIVNEVNKQVNQYAQPIVRDLEEVKLLMEIQKAESKYPDFWDYKDAIHQLGRTQPHLTIEQAYLIATGQNKGAKSEKPTSGDRRSAVITGLPPRPKYSGEKPAGSISPTLTSKDPESIKDAASLAWDKVVGSDKKDI